MSSPTTGSTEPFLFALPAQAVRAEREKLQSARSEIILFGGDQIGSMAGFFYYRFEVPEDLYLRPVDRVSCTFNQLQPVTIDGRIVSLENQFVVIALPMDFGPILPEIKCKWSYDDHLHMSLNCLRVPARRIRWLQSFSIPKNPAIHTPPPWGRLSYLRLRQKKPRFCRKFSRTVFRISGDRYVPARQGHLLWLP